MSDPAADRRPDEAGEPLGGGPTRRPAMVWVSAALLLAWTLFLAWVAWSG